MNVDDGHWILGDEVGREHLHIAGEADHIASVEWILRGFPPARQNASRDESGLAPIGFVNRFPSVIVSTTLMSLIDNLGEFLGSVYR